METKNLKSMAREVAELALQLAALPADGSRYDVQVLSDIEYAARRIVKEVIAARAENVRPVGESSGVWRVMQPGALPR